MYCDLELEEGFYLDDIQGRIVRVLIFNNGFFNSPAFFTKENVMPNIEALIPLCEVDELAEFLTTDLEWISSDRKLYLQFFNYCIENELYSILHELKQNNNKIT